MKKLQIGVKAIILYKSKVLMIKRSGMYGQRLKDLWDIPGGRIEIGEEPEDGLHREVGEELGKVRFNILRPIHVDSVVNDKERQIVRVTYECIYKGGSVILSDEHTEFSWFSKNNLPKKVDRLARKAISILGV